jgi:FkbM family methyltransferase
MQKLLRSGYIGLVKFKSNIQYNLRKVLKTFTLKGVRLSINDDKVLSKFVLLSVLNGGYEDKENKVIKEKLQPGDIMLELGAGLGFNSITAAKINGGKIVSYEANPYLFSLIKRNQELNQAFFEIRNKILLNVKPISSSIPFNISANFNFSSVKDYKVADHSVVEVKQIETEYLPDVLAELSPTFLMVDIEGGEQDFFSKPEIFLNSSVQKILVDLHPWVIGDDGCTSVIRNVISAGFDLETEWCCESIFYFSRRK